MNKKGFALETKSYNYVRINTQHGTYQLTEYNPHRSLFFVQSTLAIFTGVLVLDEKSTWDKSSQAGFNFLQNPHQGA